MTWPRHSDGRSIVQASESFSRFRSAVYDHHKFDVGTKNAILEASLSVASLISRTGDKVVYIGSGTIIECEACDESFVATILTSATFLQGPAGESSIPPNLEIKKKKRIQTRDRKMKIKKKKRIQTRDRKMKIIKSPASSAGLCCDDVITRCDGNSVGGPLELTEALWNKEGKHVELIVIRPRIGQLKLTATVGTSPKIKRWHVPDVDFLWTLEKRLALERKAKS